MVSRSGGVTSGAEPVEARAVEDAAGLRLVAECGQPRVREPGAEAGASTGGIHDQIGAEGFAVLEPHPAHGGDLALGRDVEPGHARAVAQGHRRFVSRDAVEHPLEGEAPTREQREIVVSGLRRAVVDALAKQVRDRELFGPALEQHREHVGQAIPEQVPEAREEGVGVPDLRRAASIPGLEGLGGVGREGRRVAFEDRDVVPGAPEQEPRAEAGDTRSDDEDARHQSAPSRRRESISASPSAACVFDSYNKGWSCLHSGSQWGCQGKAPFGSGQKHWSTGKSSR